MTTIPSSVQFGRQCSVLLYGPLALASLPPLAQVGPDVLAQLAQVGPYSTQNENIALSINGTPDPNLGEGFRIVFRTWQGTTVTPGEITMRIYNVAPATYHAIQGNKFQRVAIQAGYQSNPAIIFDGLIRQVLWGHENATDSYIDILASDNDEIFSAVVSGTVRGPVSITDQLRMWTNATGLSASQIDNTTDEPTRLPRGKVFFGLLGDYGRSMAQSIGAQVFIEDGKIVLMPVSGYRTGVVVTVSPQTGLIGFPELTPEGLNLTVLLNPKLRLGGLIDLQADFNKLPTPAGGVVLKQESQQELATFSQGQFAQVSPSGLYKIAVIEHEGDTRGDPWYSHLVCFAADVDVPAANACPISPGFA